MVIVLRNSCQAALREFGLPATAAATMKSVLRWETNFPSIFITRSYRTFAGPPGTLQSQDFIGRRFLSRVQAHLAFRI